MPIKGLSGARRPSRGGFLRIGERRKNAAGKIHPTRLEYFKPDFEDKALEKLFTEIYSKEPNRVTVCFMSANPEDVFSQWYKLYGSGSGIKCRGDGEIATRFGSGGDKEVECIGPENCEYSLENGTAKEPAGCRRKAILSFFIKGLPVVQVFQTPTGGINSIININSGLDLLGKIAERSGREVFGLWVDLVLRPQEATHDGRKVNIFVLDIVIPGKLNSNMALENTAATPALPAPPVETPAPITDEPPQGTEHDPIPETSGDLATDPAVVTALTSSGFSEAKKNALVQSAIDNGKTAAELIAQIKGMPPAPAPVADEAPGGVQF